MSASKKHLIVKGCAGLGNRLVTILSAIKYCEKNGRILVVDWSDGQFDKKGIDAFEKCFDVQNASFDKIDAIKNWDMSLHSSSLFKNNKTEGIYDLYVDKQSSFWQKVPGKLVVGSALKKLRRRWQPISNGNYFNSLVYGSDLPNNKHESILYFLDFIPYINYSTLPNYIQLKPFLNNKLESYIKQSNISHSVGIHIRDTDKRPTAEVRKIINHIKLNYKNSPIFLSTDSTEIENLFLKEISSLILFPKNKPQLKGEGLHQWALYNNEEELKYILFEESIMEMFLLSRCKYLFFQGNSTFSNVSKVYHQNKNNCYDWLKL
ncbi:MAG: hypothetical protein K9H41_00435 [Bacteroidia bacterium]|nr:hypothetical protein [Bacteroidia bacterium]